jgi:hypothetical protein
LHRTSSTSSPTSSSASSSGADLRRADRITRNAYDEAGQRLEVHRAWGTCGDSLGRRREGPHEPGLGPGAGPGPVSSAAARGQGEFFRPCRARTSSETARTLLKEACSYRPPARSAKMKPRTYVVYGFEGKGGKYAVTRRFRRARREIFATPGRLRASRRRFTATTAS